MEPLSCALSIGAAIQLTGSIAKICGGYIGKVKTAKEDILNLQQEIHSLTKVLSMLQQLFYKLGGTDFTTSRALSNDVIKCSSVLERLKEKIDPEAGKNPMRMLGLRALKWPLQRTEVEQIMNDIEKYKTLFSLALQADQMGKTDCLDLKIDLSKLRTAKGATFDSYNNQHSECLPGTRIELLREVEEWTTSPHGKCIFWLNGMAGTGKSTISQTFSRRLREKRLLGASFFFKRGEGDRGNAARLFPTITTQLINNIPEMIPLIRKAIGDNPQISTASLREQFDKLLLQPILGMKPSKHQTTVVVIDALDECEREEDVRLILRLLPQVQESTALCLRFFLTSRPDLPVRLGFKDIAHDHQDFTLHEIPKPVIERDISLFLKQKLSEIRHDRSLPQDWPGDENVQILTKMAVPLFIFAATICRIFADAQWDPVDSLTEILACQSEEPKLDGTYMPVLNRLLVKQSEIRKARLAEEFRKVVGAIIILESPLSTTSLSKLINVPEGLVEVRLSTLHSVLCVPNDKTEVVRLFHQSFRDFLLDPQTREKTPFWVDETEMHQKINSRCLEIMRRSLKKNICGLQNDGVKRVEIDTLSINQHLPPELQYSCRYWARHLVQSKEPTAQLEDAFSFLQEHFLHWVESMSFLGTISEVVSIIDTLQSVIQEKTESKISEFLHDAKRFILKNIQIADTAPLQLYCSGLIFAPNMAITRRKFALELPNWLCHFPKVAESWNAELQILEGHLGSVYSVSFSPNGQLVASGSGDRTVKLWDTATGSLQQTLNSHSSSVRSVAFSPNGELLASCSDDRTVKLWDPVTGLLQQTLHGHKGWVWSVIFSSDGQVIASGSDDKTIKLWDPITGSLKQTLENYSGSVRAVSFSPDGRLVASGSSDKSVKLWDTAFGLLQQTLKGHTGTVYSVAFSPDGQLVASGSTDNTVKLWNTSTGLLQRTLKNIDWVRSVAFSPNDQLMASASDDKTVKFWDPTLGLLQQTFEGHSGSVQSVAFSPNGRLMASGSDDRTVRLWDPANKTLQHNINGHSNSVQSIAFSPDGRLAASGSNDKTVKLWDPATGLLQRTLDGHSGPVRSVVFSPNAQLVASGSGDKTVKLWDTATGLLQHTLKGHLNWVYSVAFSPNGQLVASGSNDKTVKLWDPITGSLQHTLKGHIDWVRSVVFSPDSQLVASASDDRTVKLWDSATGLLQHNLKGHLNWVHSVAFSPDGRLVASGSDDETVKLWDRDTGSLRQTLNINGVVIDINFSEHIPCLNTNLGSFNIQPWSSIHTLSSPHTNIEVSIEGHC
ncbi:hypothetical protein BBP40_005451 [Aspergillus hancockii]|nr:hypothetical protein BBP40_005451 [Aspergillus hancockii]